MVDHDSRYDDATADAVTSLLPDEAGRSSPGGSDGAPPAGAGTEAVEDGCTLPFDDLKAVVEALIFASPDPLTPRGLHKLLDGDARPEEIDTAVEAVKHDYERAGGLQLVEVAGGYQIVTRPERHEWVRRLFHEQKTQKLSVQALETLAVIAYKQPVTAAEIGEIRGVNSSGVLSTLVDRRLIKIVGRKSVIGRPFMYGTTSEFLNRFGLRDLNDLPRVEDMADALGFEPPLLSDSAVEIGLPFDAGDETGAGREPTAPWQVRDQKPSLDEGRDTPEDDDPSAS